MLSVWLLHPRTPGKRTQCWADGRDPPGRGEDNLHQLCPTAGTKAQPGQGLGPAAGLRFSWRNRSPHPQEVEMDKTKCGVVITQAGQACLLWAVGPRPPTGHTQALGMKSSWVLSHASPHPLLFRPGQGAGWQRADSSKLTLPMANGRTGREQGPGTSPGTECTEGDPFTPPSLSFLSQKNGAAHHPREGGLRWWV